MTEILITFAVFAGCTILGAFVWWFAGIVADDEIAREKRNRE